MKYAFFDFDNTLAKGDSIVSFMRYSVKKKETGPGQWIKAFNGFMLQKFDPGKTSIAKEKALSFLNGRTETDIRSFCIGYLNDVLSHSFYGEGIRMLQTLQREGYTIVVVSASTSCYMDLLPAYLPVDKVICTRMIYENGRYSGRVGPNCKGGEKVRRIADELNLTGDEEADSLAYGDSLSDIPMLKYSAHPTFINPRHKLQSMYPEIPAVYWKGMNSK